MVIVVALAIVFIAYAGILYAAGAKRAEVRSSPYEVFTWRCAWCGDQVRVSAALGAKAPLDGAAMCAACSAPQHPDAHRLKHHVER